MPEKMVLDSLLGGELGTGGFFTLDSVGLQYFSRIFFVLLTKCESLINYNYLD